MLDKHKATMLGASALAIALGATAAGATESRDCTALPEKLDIADVTVVAATHQPAGDGLPAHCVLRADANRRVGEDGKSYAIGFEMRLPDDWSGRFLFQGNGGSDGEVVPATGGGSQPNAYGNQPALARGFAVISTDAGHNGADPANADAGLAAGAMFGLDPQARRDYGYNANLVLTPIAKRIVADYYGRAPDWSYFAGCSNGGRHAMVAAERLADAFDGILAGAPGFNLPRAAVQHAWDIQSLQLADPDSRKSFSPGDMQLVADAVTKACDGLDGVEDGIVANTNACQSTFDIGSLNCEAGQNEACLSAGQVEALDRIFAGPVNSKGEALYTDWPYDAGIGSPDWRFWKIESGIPPWDGYPLIATMGASSLAYVFTSPPTEVAGTPQGLIDYLSAFDFDVDAPKIDAEWKGESPMSFMTPPGADDPTLAAFRQNGGKLIVYHGVSDAVFSVNDTIAWYEKLNENTEGAADDSVRLYTVPGMNHCAAGPATDQFDLLSALIDWVENDQAPDSVIATVSATADLPDGWSQARSRPLCNWPTIATYVGGDVESADSFACRMPD